MDESLSRVALEDKPKGGKWDDEFKGLELLHV